MFPTSKLNPSFSDSKEFVPPTTQETDIWVSLHTFEHSSAIADRFSKVIIISACIMIKWHCCFLSSDWPKELTSATQHVKAAHEPHGEINFCLHVQKTLLIYWQDIISKQNCKRTNKKYCPVKNSLALPLLVPCTGTVENHIFAWYKVNYRFRSAITHVPQVLLEGSWQEASKTQTVLWDIALKLVYVDNIPCKKWKKKRRKKKKKTTSWQIWS